VNMDAAAIDDVVEADCSTEVASQRGVRESVRTERAKNVGAACQTVSNTDNGRKQ